MKKKEVLGSFLVGMITLACGHFYARKLAKKHAKEYVRRLYELKTLDKDYENYLEDHQEKVTIVLLPSVFEDEKDQQEDLNYLKTLGTFNYFLYPVQTSLDPETLVSIENYLVSYYGREHKIILFGKGTGANEMLNCASLYTLKQTCVLISVGASQSATSFIKEHLKKEHPFLTPMILSNMVHILKEYYDIHLEEDTILSYLKHNKIPTCFIHSRYDEHVNIEHVYPLYNATQAKKELFILNEETSLNEISQEDDYHLTLKQFIEKYI